MSITGGIINPNDPATPCGLIAKTFFNDTFEMHTYGHTKIKISEKNIALYYDRENYKNTEKKDK